MTISQRIFSILKDKKLKQKDLSTKTGIPESTISDWKKKNTNPAAESISVIADFLEVSSEYLLTGKEELSSTLTVDENELLQYFRQLPAQAKGRLIGRAELLVEQIKAEKKIVETPMIKCRHSYYKVSAGKGFSLGEGDAWQDEIEIPDTPLNRKADFCVTIKGDSMEPLFKDDDTVLVKSQDSVEPGQIGIFNVGGEGFIKKFGGDRLISLNEEYDDILFSEHQYENIKCVGIVLGRI